MAKKRKNKMSGTEEGKDEAFNKTLHRCSDAYERSKDWEQCVFGADFARHPLRGEPYDRCTKKSKGDDAKRMKCVIGAWFYKDELQKLPKSLAGKKRRLKGTDKGYGEARAEVVGKCHKKFSEKSEDALRCVFATGKYAEALKKATRECVERYGKDLCMEGIGFVSEALRNLPPDLAGRKKQKR